MINDSQAILKQKESSQNFSLIFFLILINIFARLMPHPANMTPLTNTFLLAGQRWSKASAIAALFLTLLGSDLALHFMDGYSWLGSWTFFTYTGFIFNIYLGKYIKSITALPFFVLTGAIGYWLWTNVGCFLLSGLYPYTKQGFLMCYIAALPFLRNQILGDLIWMIVFGLLFKNNQLISKTNIILPNRHFSDTIGINSY